MLSRVACIRPAFALVLGIALGACGNGGPTSPTQIGPGWGGAQLLWAGEFSDDCAFTPIALAFDREGHALAAWLGTDARPGQPRCRVWASRSSSGGDWTDPQPLDTGAASFRGQLALDVAPNGCALASWNEDIPQFDAVREGTGPWAAYYTPGMGWSLAQPIDTGSGSWTTVAIDDSCEGIVVWSVYAGTIWSKWASYGRGWSAATLVAAADAEYQNLGPRVVRDGRGGAIVAWVRRRRRTDQRDQAQIQVSRYDAKLGWEPVSTIGSPFDAAFAPALVSEPDGAATLVFQSEKEIRSSRFDPRTGWTEPVSVASQVDRWQLRSVEGLPVLMWASGVELRLAHHGQHGWQEQGPLRLEAPQQFAFASDPEQALIAWTEQHVQPDATVRARRFAGQGGWGAEARLQDPTAERYPMTVPPAVALDGRGGGVALWKTWELGSSLGHTGIWFRRFTRR